MPSTKSPRIELPSPNRTVAVTMVLVAGLCCSAVAAAQANPSDESPQDFGEISNTAPTTATSTNTTAPNSPGVAPPVAAPMPSTSPTPAPVPNAAAAPAAPAPPAPIATKPESAWLRDGFYLRIMDGVGYMAFRGDGAQGSASVSGMSVNSIIAIGGSIMRGVVLAGTLQSSEASGDFKGGPYTNAVATANGESLALTKKATAGLSQIGALLDWYPSLDSGAHVAVGAGLGMISLVNQIDESTYFGTSAAGTLLLGYDWSIAHAWALGLALVGTGSTKSTLKHPKTGNDTGYSFVPWSVGISTSVLYF